MSEEKRRSDDHQVGDAINTTLLPNEHIPADGVVEVTEKKKDRTERDGKKKSKESRRSREDSRKERRKERHRSPRHRRHRSRSPRRRRYSRNSSRSPRRSYRSSRRHRHRSTSIEYGGYIPRRRHDNAPQEDTTRLTGFSIQGQSLQNVSRLQQGFLPLPCPTRQVYVGNLVPGLVSDMALRTLFNSALSAAFPEARKPGSEPVVSVSMHSDGRYAFIELRSPEMATSALQLSGQVQLFGQTITVGRPSGYVDPGKAAAAAQAAAAALAAFNNGQVSAEQTFGGTNAPSGTKTLGQVIASTMASTPSISAFISIEGLIELAMLVSNEAYREIVRNLRNECVKYGPVIQLKIPRPADPEMAHVLYDTGFYGKAFVQFADATTAMRAKEGLVSLASQNKTLTIEFVSQEVFIAII